jgi:hypothetical protein
MRELTSVVLEMDRQGKRLHGLLRVGRLNTMRRSEFTELVAIVDKLGVNLTDFNALHFGSVPVYTSRARKPPGSANTSKDLQGSGESQKRKSKEGFRS